MSGHVNAEQNTKTLETFWQALREGDVALLEEVCHPDFRLVEPDLFGKRFNNFEEYRADVARTGPRGDFELLDVEPIGDTLLVESTWTPPGGGEITRHRVIWSFWDGKVSRIDGKSID